MKVGRLSILGRFGYKINFYLSFQWVTPVAFASTCYLVVVCLAHDIDGNRFTFGCAAEDCRRRNLRFFNFTTDVRISTNDILSVSNTTNIFSNLKLNWRILNSIQIIVLLPNWVVHWEVAIFGERWCQGRGLNRWQTIKEAS